LCLPKRPKPPWQAQQLAVGSIANHGKRSDDKAVGSMHTRDNRRNKHRYRKTTGETNNNGNGTGAKAPTQITKGMASAALPVGSIPTITNHKAMASAALPVGSIAREQNHDNGKHSNDTAVRSHKGSGQTKAVDSRVDEARVVTTKEQDGRHAFIAGVHSQEIRRQPEKQITSRQGVDDPETTGETNQCHDTGSSTESCMRHPETTGETNTERTKTRVGSQML
jgi:hypothetical protein